MLIFRHFAAPRSAVHSLKTSDLHDVLRRAAESAFLVYRWRPRRSLLKLVTVQLSQIGCPIPLLVRGKYIRQPETRKKPLILLGSGSPPPKARHSFTEALNRNSNPFADREFDAGLDNQFRYVLAFITFIITLYYHRPFADVRSVNIGLLVELKT